MQENSKLLQIIPFVKGFETVFDIIFDTQNSGIFVSRVGLVLKVIGWDEIELICRFEKEFLFLSLQASCLRWLYLLFVELQFCLLVSSSSVTVGLGDRNIATVIFWFLSYFPFGETKNFCSTIVTSFVVGDL